MDSDRNLLMNELERLVKERDSLKKQVELLNKLVDVYKADSTEIQNVFDIVWKADMRAVRLWRKFTGKDYIMPDRCDLVVFLLKELDDAKRMIRKLQKEETE